MPEEKKFVTSAEINAQSQSKNSWFNWYVDRLDTKSTKAPRQENSAYRCPCCGYLTLKERGGYDICSVCCWEDDGQDDQDADTVRGGPNGLASLAQARENYKAFGASLERRKENVCPPKPEEL